MHNHCVRQLKLAPEEWERLERIAHETYSANHDGPHALRISWLALIRRIARGELLVVPAKKNEHLERVDEAIAKLALSSSTALTVNNAEGNKQREKQESKAAQRYEQLSILEPA